MQNVVLLCSLHPGSVEHFEPKLTGWLVQCSRLPDFGTTLVDTGHEQTPEIVCNIRR